MQREGRASGSCLVDQAKALRCGQWPDAPRTSFLEWHAAAQLTCCFLRRHSCTLSPEVQVALSEVHRAYWEDSGALQAAQNVGSVWLSDWARLKPWKPVSPLATLAPDCIYRLLPGPSPALSSYCSQNRKMPPRGMNLPVLFGPSLFFPSGPPGLSLSHPRPRAKKTPFCSAQVFSLVI